MRKTPFYCRLLGLFAIVAALCTAACHGGGAGVPQLAATTRGDDLLALGERAHPIDKIKHVVIIIQENRSLNNLFYGYPGATTASYGLDSANKKITLQPVGLSTKWDLEHNHEGFELACNGTGTIPGTKCRMNGFDQETKTCDGASEPKCPIKYPQYSYVPHDESAPYFSMANQYVLGDQMYASNFDTSSYVSHQYIIAGQAGTTVDYPVDNWGCPGGPKDLMWTLYTSGSRVRTFKGTQYRVPTCFDYTTLGDELDDAKPTPLTWAFYANALGSQGSGAECGTSGGVRPAYNEGGIWSSYQAIKHICYGPDWNTDIINPPSQFITDVGNGNLRDVTWITPTCPDSDHPGCDSDGGPSWVTSVVNAVGQSKFWNSTAIFIFWDDYGGFYDPEAPKYLDYDGLGMRVPLLIISPYAKKGHVSHVHYEHGSILRFIEDRFNLPRLAASDTRATSPAADCFDFSQPPRKFVPITSKYDTRFILHQPYDPRPPDTN